MGAEEKINFIFNDEVLKSTVGDSVIVAFIVCIFALIGAI